MRKKKDIIRLKDAIVSMGDGDKDIPVEVKSEELYDLKIVFEKHLDRVLSKIKDAIMKNKEYEQFLEENKTMRSDRIVAEQIQKSMLETQYPAFPEFPQIDLFADMDAAGEIGGDFYDYFKIDDNHICFSIADVEGKGIPAAMYMAIAKTMIRIRLESGDDLSEVISTVSMQLCQSSMKRRFITLWIGILEVSTGELTYINAGHNYPILKRKDLPAEYLKMHSGIPIASYYSKKKPMPVYTVQKITLKKHDILLLYTDGVTETTDEESNMFGEDRLLTSVDLYAKSYPTMQDFTAYLKRQTIRFLNSAAQADDITILAMQYK